MAALTDQIDDAVEDRDWPAAAAAAAAFPTLGDALDALCGSATWTTPDDAASVVEAIRRLLGPSAPGEPPSLEAWRAGGEASLLTLLSNPAFLQTRLPVVARLLLAGPADPNATTANGRTPLHLLAASTVLAPVCTEIAMVLIDSGAHPGVLNGEHETAYAVAVENNQVRLSMLHMLRTPSDLPLPPSPPLGAHTDNAARAGGHAAPNNDPGEHGLRVPGRRERGGGAWWAADLPGGAGPPARSGPDTGGARGPGMGGARFAGARAGAGTCCTATGDVWPGHACTAAAAAPARCGHRVRQRRRVEQ